MNRYTTIGNVMCEYKPTAHLHLVDGVLYQRFEAEGTTMNQWLNTPTPVRTVSRKWFPVPSGGILVDEEGVEQ